MLKSTYMQGSGRNRFLITVVGIVSVLTITVITILFARGYRPDLATGRLKATGILAASSQPDSAKLYLNGTLTTVTKANLNLNPGQYLVEIKQDGFSPWSKTVTVSPEVVTQIGAVLFPTVPSLKAITSDGAANPVLSPDGTKVVFTSNNSLYLLDLTESPLGLINRDPKPIIENFKIKIGNLSWSPNSRQIIAVATSSAYLIDLSSSVPQPLSDSGASTLSDWDTTQKTVAAERLATLPILLQNLLATSAADLVWAPKENKLLYTATASATIPSNLKNPLPGSSSQKQERTLKPNSVYIYDLEEDRNFKIDSIIPVTPTPSPKKNRTLPKLQAKEGHSVNAGWTWFPTSNHLLKVVGENIYIVEYDAQNLTTVYSGPLIGSFAAPYPSGKQLLILTNLNSASSLSNLYALSLK
jgi:hypothetical protein